MASSELDGALRHDRELRYPAAYHKAAVPAFTETDSITEALTAHIWTISRSAKRKHQLVTPAIQLLVVAMGLAIISMLVR